MKFAYQNMSQFVANIFETETLRKATSYYSKRNLDDEGCSAGPPQTKKRNGTPPQNGLR